MTTLYPIALIFIVALGAFSFPALFFIPAPYGRHAQADKGIHLNTKLAWVLMEAPAPIVFVVVYFLGSHATSSVPLFLLGLWLTHYVYRSFIFPLRMRGGSKNQPLTTFLLAVAFNTANGFVNAYAISHMSPHLANGTLADPRLLAGALVFFTGYTINHQSDAILRNLRKPGESGYKIPHGGLYRWVSCPNYLGELIEWAGFALAASTLPALVFVLFTASNLVPRAVTHHRWYRKKFPDYPSDRKAIFPYVL
jgi:protein-S-isoprenylcysteine O-methyltransferase Ste14